MGQNMQEICENIILSVIGDDFIILAWCTHIMFAILSVSNCTYWANLLIYEQKFTRAYNKNSFKAEM